MGRYTSPHDEPWFADPEQPWGGIQERRTMPEEVEDYVDPPIWKESSVRMCLDCGVTARIRDGVHEECVGRGGPRDYLKAKGMESGR